MLVFTFFCFRLETHFLGKFGPKKWYLDSFQQAEFNGGVHFVHYFWANLNQKIYFYY